MTDVLLSQALLQVQWFSLISSYSHLWVALDYSQVGEMADISEAELQEQKDAIQLFNDANNGKVNIHDLRKLLRSFGEK